MLADCGCEPASTGCHECLCDYHNQYAHTELSRGAALIYLDQLTDQLDHDTSSPWRTAREAPGREIAETLRSTPGPVTLVVPSIRPGLIPGLNRDWFDLLKEAAVRPSSRGHVTIVLGAVPSAEDLFATDAVARAGWPNSNEKGRLFSRPPRPSPRRGWPSARAVRERSCGDGRKTKPSAPTCRGPPAPVLAAQAEARAVLDALPSGVAVEFPPTRRFRHFSLAPGKTQDPFDDRYLGEMLRHPIKRLLVVDPYIAISLKKVLILDRFLARLTPTTQGMTLRVRASVAEGTHGNFHNKPEQEEKSTKVWGRHAPAIQLELQLSRDGRLKEHDRILLIHVTDGVRDHYCRVLLGQGLEGFERTCERYSEGVWFDESAEDLEQRLEGAIGSIDRSEVRRIYQVAQILSICI